jgi:DNA-directed RNA polymerase specialized sigma24 family protein
MTRLAEAESLRRIENAARTTGEFQELSDWYDKLDDNRERRLREYETILPTSEIFTNEYTDGAIIPPPLAHPYWRELMRGDFISTIYDNAAEIWQVFGDWDVGRLVKSLSDKQRDVLFRSAVRGCSALQIAECVGITKRGVNKLLATALEIIRIIIADSVRYRLEKKLPVTLEKQRFYEWYRADEIAEQAKLEAQKETPGDKPGE